MYMYNLLISPPTYLYYSVSSMKAEVFVLFAPGFSTPTIVL